MGFNLIYIIISAYIYIDFIEVVDMKVCQAHVQRNNVPRCTIISPNLGSVSVDWRVEVVEIKLC